MNHSPHRSGRIGAHLRNNAVGYVALFFALTIGTAYANHPGGANTISTDDIIDSEVRSVDINNGAVNTEDITNDGIRTEDVRDDTSPGGGLAAADLGPASVGTSEVVDESLTAGDLAIGSVATGEVANASLTGADLANFAVGTLQLADLGVTRNKIAIGAVGSQQIADFSLLNRDIGSAQVDNRNLATGAVNGRALLDDSVGGADLDAVVTRVNSVEVFEAEDLPTGVTASCNADEVVIGGGADWAPALDNSTLIESRRSGNGWRVLGYYGDGPGLDEEPDSSTLEAEAYCLAP
jgi:hypothetical protein